MADLVLVIIRALVLATRVMACMEATQITAYMEVSAAIRDMERTEDTEDPAVTQAAAMEALREL